MSGIRHGFSPVDDEVSFSMGNDDNPREGGAWVDPVRNPEENMFWEQPLPLDDVSDKDEVEGEEYEDLQKVCWKGSDFQICF